MSSRFKYAAGLIFAAFLFMEGGANATEWQCCAAHGQRSASNAQRPHFAYDLGADIRFDNREYAACEDWEPSCTLFGIRANLAIGLKIGSEGTATHRILGGISGLYQFGGSLDTQPLLYYKMLTPLKHSHFSILAGAFDRNESKAWYSSAFYSSRDRFLDNVYEGIQFSWEKGGKYYFELGVDWKGMLRFQSPATREEFQVYSGGEYKIKSWLKAAYSAYMHHYACSMEEANVVDNIMANPYLEFDFGPMVRMQSLMLRTGVLVGYEWDRAAGGSPAIPVNGNIYFRARKWNVIIDNEIYFGSDAMPLYGELSPAGYPYAGNLYMGEAMLRHRHGEIFGYYDRLGIAWEPRIVKVSALSFQLRVNLDFNGGFLGSQQIIQISYKF